MANIQNQIDEISTAFYGSQVRGAIVEGLQSINDEVNSLNTNITEVDSKTEKMDAIVSTSTEKIQELIGEYNNINTEAQEKFKQIDGALSNVLVNSKITNPTIIGTVTNTSTFEGGTFENCSIEGPTISNASLDGSVTLIGGTGIQGGAITNTTLSGTIKNIAQINGGTYDNPTFIGGSIENQGTFNGGIYSNPTIEAFGNNIIQYNKLPYSVLISPGITATGTVEFFLINGPQLGGENITGSIGIVTVTTTLDEWYTWPTDNNIVVDINGIPNATARTISPFNNLNIGIDQGQLYMSGVGTALNNGQTYTNQALLWQ